MSDIPSAVLPGNAADASVASLKLPPHSLEAEQSVLGGLMLEETAWDRAAEIVSESDFYRRDHLVFNFFRRQALNRCINLNLVVSNVWYSIDRKALETINPSSNHQRRQKKHAALQHTHQLDRSPGIKVVTIKEIHG